MREMIISELNQALHDIARGFAHFLPRFIVMLILVFASWVIARVVKAVLRSILRVIKFDKLSENAGASQLLTKAALPSATELLSRFVFWVTWLGFILLGVRVLDPGHGRANRKILSVSAASVRSAVHSVFRTAGSQLLFSRRFVGCGECECAFTTGFEPGASRHHYCFRIVDRL